MGPPKLKTIVVREIPDENTSINELRTHDIDWMFEPSPNLYNVLKTLPGHDDPSRRPARDTALAHQSAHARTSKTSGCAARSPTRSIKSRWCDRLTGGSARVAGADQPPFSWAYRPNVRSYGPDVAKARALLTQAGVRPGSQRHLARRTAGRSRSNCRPTAPTPPAGWFKPKFRPCCKLPASTPRSRITPATSSSPPLAKAACCRTGKYDLAIYGWIAGIDPDDHSLYGCDKFPPARRELLPLLLAGDGSALSRPRSASYDEPPRKKAYYAIQKLIAADVPEIIVWYPRTPQATNPDFKGFAPNPVNEAWNAYQWEI